MVKSSVSDRFRTVQHRIKDGCWHAEAIVVCVKRAQVGESGIGRACDHGKSVEKCSLIIIEQFVRARHCTPYIPGEHLHIVKRCDVTDQVARDEPKAAHIEDAEFRWINFTRTA